jgi:error-prone DNA polymerase
MKLSYAALHCLTNFSFLRGASHAEQLVIRASELGYCAIAITDECSVSGVVRAHVAAKEHGMKLIVGAEFAVHDAPAIARLIVLAKTLEGYGDMCELITLARSRAKKGEYRLFIDDLAHLCHHSKCLAIVIPDIGPNGEYSHCIDSIVAIADYFSVTGSTSCWLGAALDYGPDDKTKMQSLEGLAENCGLPIVACENILFATRDQKQLQDVVTSIRLKKPVAELGADLLAHAESYMKPIGHVVRRYPLPMITQTIAIEKYCTFSLENLRYQYPREVVPSGETPAGYLRKQTYEGAARRYPCGIPDKVRKIIEHELEIISDLMYEAYFLTIYDIVNEARKRDILCQGRGSAANSAVCYCLGITEVDPELIEVLFERFISRERKEPPDIDVDFEHQRREEIMQYIYEKYGRDRTALTAAVSTYHSKGAIRDVGKALGLSLSQVDALSKAIVWWDGRTIESQRLVEAGFDPEAPRMRLLMKLTEELVGFPRHLSQHTGGFVIARDKLTRLVPVENAAMPDRTVVQWDKDDLDAVGLLKVDVLALGMLSAIRSTLKTLNGWHDKQLTMQTIPREDDDTYQMIQKADTIGVFQIESRAQMSMLPRLKPKKFYDLVIEVAIVRPGPIQGGMVHPYLKRRNGEKFIPPSPEVGKVLIRTLGVPIFQEQVMQIAIDAAGFTPDEADRLRRAMAAWKRKGGIGPFRDKLINGLLANGCDLDFAERLYKQMQGFGEYGFPESHAASFALLVYISCWLKCHHPAAFTCGLLNSQPLGFYSPAQLVQDAQRHGVTALPVDVTISQWSCTLEGHKEKPSIRLGLCMVSGFNEEAGNRLVSARNATPFIDVTDLRRRAGLDPREINALASADTLATLVGHRRDAIWEVLGLENDTRLIDISTDGSVPTLLPPAEADDVFADYRTVGLSLRNHPVALLRPALSKLRIRSSEEIRNARQGQLARATGMVTCRQHPQTAKGTTFVTLEDETGYVNVVVWSHLAKRQRKELVFSRLLCVAGRVERQGDVVHLIAGRLIDQTAMLGKLSFSSREFH